MKTYAHFDQAGNFSCVFEADPAELPPIPLADDGLPRTIELAPEPVVPAGKQHVISRAGAWLEVDAEPEPVPVSVSAASFGLALITAGILPDAVQARVEAIPDPVFRARANWLLNRAAHFERDDPTLLVLAAAWPMTAEQLDAIFRAAGALDYAQPASRSFR